MKRVPVAVLLGLSLLFGLTVSAHSETPQTSVDTPTTPPAEFLPGVPEPLRMSCSADTTCSSGVQISCTASGTSQCTSFSDRVECGDSGTGTCSVECGPVDAHQACLDSCEAAFQTCISGCPFPITRTCGQPCYQARFQCQLNCGPAPSTSCSV